VKLTPRPAKKTRVEVVQDPPQTDIKCAECSGPMRLLRAINIETEEVQWMFWGCKRYPDCYCTHSAHPDGRPMGTPANQATRDARHAVHGIFDKLWKRGGYMTRAGAYRWLTEKFGATEQVHIGNMTLEECDQVSRWSVQKFAELDRERKSIERGKRVNKGLKPNRRALYDDRKHRAQKLDRKLERRHRSEPAPAAPKPEPEEEPPREHLKLSVWRGMHLKQARYRATLAFDRLWRGGLMVNADATEWLMAKTKGLRIERSNLRRCEQIEVWCDAKRAELVKLRRRRKELREAPKPLAIETVTACSAAVDLFGCLEDSRVISFGEGVRLPDETEGVDWNGEELATEHGWLTTAIRTRHWTMFRRKERRGECRF
jgi:ssDNA-binding Zn-finger/Zn-ribbon topoisomerase 1